MKKITLPFIIAFSLFSLKSNAQVGINTSTPASTLEIIAKNATGSATNVDGLLIPRVDRLRAQTMASVPTSTLIYINNAVTGTQTGATANVDAEGYYYFNGTAWVKLHNPANSTFSSVNIYNTDGSLTGNRLVTQAGNTLAFTGTAANAFSVDGSTFSVDALNHRVGIGTTTPENRFQVVTTTAVSNRYTLIDAPVSTNSLPILALRNTSPAATGNYSLLGFSNTGPTGGGATWGIGSVRTAAALEEFFIGNSLGANYIERFRIASNGFVGIGTSAPTNTLHINGTNPLRLEGLQTSSGKVGTLVVNSTGVVQTQTSADISAVRATGSLTLASNNVVTLTNATAAPTETFDNLNEFSGATFTAAAAGLYKVDLSINFDQRASTNDSGDGYMGYAYIYLNGTSYSQAAVKVAIPEISGAGSFQTAITSTVVKMAAGNTLTFNATNYGSTGGNTANYTINVVRID